MDMDDPWGSPWADYNDVSPTPKPDAEVKTTTVVAKNTPATPKEPLNSPWGDDDDDGFGDWSTGPEVGTTQESNGGLVEEDPWATNGDSQNTNTLARAEDLRPAWEHSLKLPEENISSSLSPKENIFRQSSPDPWATEFLSEERGGDQARQRDNDDLEVLPDLNISGQIAPQPVPNDQVATTNNTGNETLQAPGHDGGEHNRYEEDSEVKTLSHVLFGQHLEELDQSDSKLDIGEDCEPTSQQQHVDILSTDTREENDSNEVDGLEVSNDSRQSSITVTVEESNSLVNPETESSRSSSAPSDHSRHDEQNFPESPRTSLDEEQGHPHVSRKVSKVHELVQHFDSIIAQQVAEPEPITRSPPKVAKPLSNESNDQSEDDGDDFGDFGDFEEGFSEDEESEAPPEFGQIQSSSLEAAKKDEPIVPRSLKDYGPITFEIDTKDLDALYPDAPTATDETMFVPDTIIHDTFQSVEQRKTWYRVSRYGTMRKYNSGDDDNYKRIKWAKSNVRDETLKVVARWMEEDRISGRVVLGGGSKGSSIFGWNDSNQRPIPISSALADKRGKKKSQELSNTPVEVPREWPKMTPRQRSSSKGVSQAKEGQPKESQPKEAPAANFGWNMPPKDPYGTKAQPSIQRVPSTDSTSKARSISPKTAPSRERSESANRSPLSIKVLKTRVNPSTVDTISVKEPSQTTDQALPTKSQVSSFSGSIVEKTANAPEISKETNMVDEEDDWGEMISSPTTVPTHAFPPQKGLRHKKSMSLNGFSPPVSFDSILEPQAARPQSSQTNKSPMNFGTIGPLTENQVVQSPPQMIPFISPQDLIPQNDHKPTPIPAAVSTSSTQDPWASADFSFFDSAPPPAPVVASTSKSSQQTSKPPVKRVGFASHPVSIGPVPNQKRVSHKTKDELEQDIIVRSIVDALPDLSYMLR